jgi:hypothetical protein
MTRQIPIARVASAGLLGAAFVAALGASASPACESPPLRPMPGADRDAHGCKPSASYRWCARTQRCVRPWELAREHGFDTRRFDAFCSGTAQEDRDGGAATEPWRAAADP